ncbi:MAG: MFS transporter [Alphaproteobacteria bacterium]|nr:MFS transporter [Alphaproteobacteria bacterium]
MSLTVATIGSVGMWAIILAMPSVEQDFGTTRAEASLAYTATMLGFAFGNVAMGHLVDRFGVTPVLILASLMISGGHFLAAGAESLWFLSVCQGVLIGLGTAAGFGPLVADISHWFKKRRGIAIAAGASGNYLAGVVWPIFLRDAIDAEGWRAAYEMIGVITLVTMIPLSLFLLRKAPHLTETDEKVKAAMESPAVNAGLSPAMLQWLLIFAGVACCVAMSMPQVHIVAYCADLGYGVAVGAEMLSLMLAGGVASRLLFGLLADHIGGVKTLLLGSALQCMALFLYIPFDGLVSLYVVSLIFGLSQGGIVPSYAVVIREYLPAREAGQRIGLVMMATVIGMALGGWLSGLVFDLTGSYQLAFINGILWNFANMGIIALILFRSRPSKTALA